MALNAENVKRWAGAGGVFVDHTATAQLPTDPSSTIPMLFKDLGYLSDEGVEVSEGVEKTSIFAWQNGANVRTLQTSHDLTFSFQMMEWNRTVLATFFDEYKEHVGHREFQIIGKQAGRSRWVIQAFDADETLRVVLPSAQITEKGSWAMANSSESKFPITLTAYPDEHGVKAYGYLTSLVSS